MSKNDNSIYNRALLFSIVAAITVLIGTIATVFVPMFTKGMHPKVEGFSLSQHLSLQVEISIRLRVVSTVTLRWFVLLRQTF